MNAAQTGVTTFATPTDLDVVMRRVVDAPRRIAFEAWTNPKHIPHWMLGPPGWTMPVCEVDLRPGGAWRFVWRKEDGSEMAMSGTYREVVVPERVVTLEKWGPEWPETVNTVLFTEAGGKTTITLTVSYPTKAARDAALATGMKDGMDPSFARFDELLAKLQ
ncbi:hypothetical protein BWI17_00275 [Betaproteobacteria bacterium GR16-43]|nr:hypothetical protein BWI17_00275 [Betaproteobacteria bacterium GR16-43]